MSRSEVLASLQAQMDEIVGRAPSTEGALPKETSCDWKARRAPGEKNASAEGVTGAFKKIIDLVNASDKSEATVRARLRDKGYDPAEIDEAVTRAKSYGFIDDRRFADVLIRSRVSQGKGSAGIERELSAQNIDVNAIEGWPYDYDIDADAEMARALALLDRKPPRSKNVRDGAFRKLIAKGYPTSIASSAARVWYERSRSFYDDGQMA